MMDHFGVRLNPEETAERPQRLGDTLVGLQESERADQGCVSVDAQLVTVREAVGFGNPGTVRNARQRAGEAGFAQLRADAIAVDDRPSGPLQKTAKHGQTFIIGPGLKRSHVGPGVLHRRLVAVLLDRAHVGVPVAALDGHVSHEVVEVGLMNHHDAGMLQRGFVTKVMVNVVADLIERDVEIGRLETLGLARERRHIGDAFHLVQERGGIISDPAFGRR